MMHFVCPSNSARIPIVCIPEHFETLVNKYIVHKKISQTVCENPQTNGKPRPKAKIAPANKTANAYKCIKKKKIVVALPPTSVIFVMMVLVELP